MAHAVGLLGHHRVSDKGRMGLEGQVENTWHTVQRTFMMARTRLSLCHIFSKYFLSFSNMLDTAPGTAAIAIAGM